MKISASFWSFIGGPVVVGGSVIIGYSIYEFFGDIMPEWTAILDIKDKIEVEGKPDHFSTFLVHKIWGKYLVDSHQNESWWRWSFSVNSIRDYALTDTFKVINKAYVVHGKEPELKALNQACEYLYLKAAQLLNEHEKSDLWTFCSIGGIELENLTNKNYIRTWKLADELEQLNGDTDPKKHLVNTRYIGNIWFWDIRQKELDEGFLEGNNLFKKGSSIRKACDSIFRGITFDFNDSSSNEQLIKYCGLKHI